MSTLKMWGLAFSAIALLAWAYATGLHDGKPPDRKTVPYLIFVCGQEPEGLRYHDCTSHPLEVKSEEECNRFVAFGAWTLSTGPVTRAMREDKGVVMTCVEKSDVRDRHIEPKKPDFATVQKDIEGAS